MARTSPANKLFGVLLDVSDSMMKAYALDRSSDVSVKRIHAILTTLVNIIKRDVLPCHQQEYIFACAFGLDVMKCGPAFTGICDLISLIELVKEFPSDGHEALIDLAEREGVSRLTHFIRRDISEHEAQFLYAAIQRDSTGNLMKMLKNASPNRIVTGIASSAPVEWLFGGVSHERVAETDVYKCAVKIIRDLQQPRARGIQCVSKTLDDFLEPSPFASSQSFHHKIDEVIEKIKPYIFGGTPMCAALKSAQSVFQKSDENLKVLCIISDGESTDEDPRDIAEELRSMGVIIVTCFLTSVHIENPRRLMYYSDDSWEEDDGRRVLFEMSSTMKNTHTPVSYLVDANWELPPAGESRLFIQANSLDVVDEYCKIIVSQMAKHCDALLDLIKKVDLGTYINTENNKFTPNDQEGRTCYANAIAAVFHLAMHRIVGREGGIPDFNTILASTIGSYGFNGANTEKVLREQCPAYRLHYQEVDETGARKAINKRRPVVTTFSLYKPQWDRFGEFYRNTPKGILKRADVRGGSAIEPGGHAVVLIGCDPNCLTFMNSWSHKWADGGFFRVEDKDVLNNTRFFDVYWTLDDLKYSEKEAFRREGVKLSQELLENFPSVKELPLVCPVCSQRSKVGKYSGHVLEAVCPKCHKKFKPTNKDLIQCLYTQTHY